MSFYPAPVVFIKYSWSLLCVRMGRRIRMNNSGRTEKQKRKRSPSSYRNSHVTKSWSRKNGCLACIMFRFWSKLIIKIAFSLIIISGNKPSFLSKKLSLCLVEGISFCTCRLTYLNFCSIKMRVRMTYDK